MGKMKRNFDMRDGHSSGLEIIIEMHHKYLSSD